MKLLTTICGALIESLDNIFYISEATAMFLRHQQTPPHHDGKVVRVYYRSDASHLHSFRCHGYD